MADRITQRDLERLCDAANRRVNDWHGGSVWSRDADGSLTARVGAFYIDGAYGGVAF